MQFRMEGSDIAALVVLFFKDGRLVGGVLIGDIRMQTRIIQMIQARQVIPEPERDKLLAA